MLVADDDAALRLLCRVNLELDGYDVLEAATAEDVERMLESEKVDAVLLDVHLGADDGVVLAERLRSRRPAIGVALFTGSVERRDAWAEIADGFLAKPFTLDELAETVRALVRD